MSSAAIVIPARKIPSFFKLLPAVFLLGILLFQCLQFSAATNQTVDETFYNGSAIPLVRMHDYRFLGEHPPMVMHLGGFMLDLFLRPNFNEDQIVYMGEQNNERDLSKTGAAFLYRMGNDPMQVLFWERLAVIFLTVFLALLVYLWSRKLYGDAGGILSLALFSFSPNLIAHGSLFTTDMGVTAFYFAAAFCLYFFVEQPTPKRLFACGIAAGFALLSKISSLAWLPTSLCVFALCLFDGREAWRQLETRFFNRFLFFAALVLLVFSIANKVLAVALTPLCLLALALTEVPFERFRQYRYYTLVRSLLLAAGWVVVVIFCIKMFKKYEVLIASAGCCWAAGCFGASFYHGLRGFPEKMRILLKAFLLLWLVAVFTVIFGYLDAPVRLLRFGPLDHFLRSFNIASHHARSFHTACTGTFVTCDSAYFFKLMLVKSSVYLWIFFAAGILATILMPLKKTQKLVLLVMPLVFFLMASFVNRINIGLRHILPVYPFIMLLCGGAAGWVSSFKNKAIRVIGFGILAVFFLMYAAGTVRQAPHFLSYFSEWIGSEEKGILYTSDSNLDWGQDNYALARYVKDRGLDNVNINSSTANTDLYDHYQVRWQRFDTYTDAPPAGVYVFSIDSLAAERRKPSSWFAGRNWDEKIGRTLYVFKVSE